MNTFIRLGTFALLLSAPSWAGTVFLGIDDAVGLDYDFQDLIVSVDSPSLQLKSSGSWFNMNFAITSALATGGNAGLQYAPFFNQTSGDGVSDNIGYCIWGGGNCGTGEGLAPSAQYLTADAGSPTGSANDVTFLSDGVVYVDVLKRLASGTSLVGWYDIRTPEQIHWLNSSESVLGSAAFTPSGEFGLVSRNISLDYTFYSQSTAGGASDAVSHFAFFSDRNVGLLAAPTSVALPEPSSAVLLGTGILALVTGFAGKIRKTRQKI